MEEPKILYDHLMRSKYADQVTSILQDYGCDVDPEFLGFTSVYQHLSRIIPKHFTIIDLGCAYGFQAYYFRNHKKYVGIDSGVATVLRTDNSEYIFKPIKDFLETYEHDDPEFAICSYVPSWGGDNRSLVRHAFKNVFVFYPEHDIKEKKAHPYFPPK